MSLTKSMPRPSCILATAFVLQSLACCSLVSGATEDSYLAAVVEFGADENTSGLSPLQRLSQNVERYRQIIADASTATADIIVFPEYGLTTLTFYKNSDAERRDPRDLIDPLLQIIPEVGANPCEFPGLSLVVHNLSCAAREGKIWVVLDLAEKVMGSGDDEIQYRYNTALVFNPNGTIAAKYHKENLFAEPWFNVPERTEVVSFRTDFGIDFGIIICFDLLFESPAKELVSQGLKHFVFPTAWIDELPYLTALQAQTMWASSSNVTLLASGYHNPAFGKLGSGIFLPSGEAASYVFDPTSGTRTIYANVLKDFSPGLNSRLQQEQPSTVFQQEKQPLEFYYRENLSNYTGVTLTEDAEVADTCDGGFCCQVRYAFSKLEQPPCPPPTNSSLDTSYLDAQYKLLVFNQTRHFQSPSVVKTMALQICSVVRCLNSTIQSCAENDASSKLPGFSFLQLRASPFQTSEHSRPGIITLDYNFKPAPSGMFLVERNGAEVTFSASSPLLPTFNLQTVALFNRKY